MELLLGQRVKLHSSAGVRVPLRYRTYPVGCKGTVIERTQQQAVKTLRDKTPPQVTQGYTILLDKPHPRTGQHEHFISDFMLEKGVATVID